MINRLFCYDARGEGFDTDKRKQRLLCFLLLLLFLLGFYLRVRGYHWGLPYRLHPDEWKYVYKAVKAADGEWDTQYYKNPTGFTFSLAALFRMLSLFFSYPDVTTWYEQQPHQLYAIGRIWVAFLGACTIPFVYGIAGFFLPRRMSLLSAFLFTVAFLPIRDSHFAVNDIPLTLLCTIILWLSLRFLESPKPVRIICLGFLCGLAIGVKYNAVPVVLPVLLVLYQSKDHVGFAKYSIWLIIMIVLGFCFAVPGAIFSSNLFIRDFVELVRVSGAPVGYSENVFVPTGILATLMIGFGVIPSLLMVLGVAFLFKENKRHPWVLFSFLGTYLATLLLQHLYFSRFLLPVFPFFCILSVAGLHQIRRRFPDSIILISVLVCLLLGETLARTGKLIYMLSSADTRVQAVHLAELKVKSGMKVLSDPLALPYIHHDSTKEFPKEILFADYNKIPFGDLKLIFAAANCIFVSEYADFAVGLKKRKQGWKELLQGRKKIAVFTSRQKSLSPLSEDEVSLPFDHILEMDSSGPAITVYE